MKMGFLKKHTRPKVYLLLTTEKTEFILGEDLVGNLEVRAEEEFEIEEVRIGLVPKPGNRITECLRIYPRNSHFSTGSSQKLPFCFTTPIDTQERHPSVEKRVRSNLTVVVRIKGRGSISRNLEIALVKPAST